MEEQPKNEKEIFQALAAPFTKTIGGREYPALKWLPKDGKSMKNKIICIPYISGGQVRDRLNEVMGLSGWQFNSNLETDGTRTGTLSLFINGEWISRDGTGTKSNQEGEKGAETDALKRCGRNFGIGAYLENVAQRFVDAKANPRGKTTPIDKSGNFLYGDKLTNYLNGMSTGQGILAELLMQQPSLWDREHVQNLWNELKL